MKAVTLIIVLVTLSLSDFAQTTNDVLNLLIKNKTVTQEQADEVRADAAIKQQEQDANKKSFTISATRPIQLAGYTQVRYQFLQQVGKIDGFDIRRARLDLQGKLNPYFSYKLQADFAGSPKLIDAYAEIKIKDYFNITVGESKIPFSYENLMSDSKLELADRALVVEALSSHRTDVIGGNQNGRDLGIQVGGDFVKYKNRYLFDYKLGLFNGAGININDNNNNKDIAGRLIAHPVIGLNIGGSFYSGTAFYGTPTAGNHDRNRVGAEINYELKRFLVRSEYITGKDGALKKEGWYSQVGYFVIPTKLQFILRYDTYDPNTAITKNITTNYVFGGAYNFNNWSRIQASFAVVKKESATKTNNIGVIQYQISF